jgi:hypothetical protein
MGVFVGTIHELSLHQAIMYCTQRSIGVNEYYLTFNPRTRTVNGTYKYSFYDLNNSPLDQNTQPLPYGTFEFSYQGVKLKAD